jgi:predicted nuclease with TOPRIM domain
VVNSGKIVRADLDALVKIREITAELEELEKEFDASIHLDDEKRKVTTILRDFPAEIDAIMSAIHTLEEKKLRFENHAKTLRDPLLLTSVMAENE